MSLFNLIKRIIYELKCRRLCNEIEDCNKVKFEKEIIKLLKKFNLYNQDNSSLQKAIIIVDAGELPIVKLEYLVMDRSYLDENNNKKK